MQKCLLLRSPHLFLIGIGCRKSVSLLFLHPTLEVFSFQSRVYPELKDVNLSINCNSIKSFGDRSLWSCCIKNIYIFYFYSGGSDGKESACNVGKPGSTPSSGKSPGEGHGYPLQYSCLENSIDRGACWATVHGVTKSQPQQSSQHTHTHTHTHFLAALWGTWDLSSPSRNWTCAPCIGRVLAIGPQGKSWTYCIFKVTFQDEDKFFLLTFQNDKK